MILILDPGHGGISPGGLYLTPGKRSPSVPPGVYEGEFNRRVADAVEALCVNSWLEVVNLCPGPLDAPIASRRDYVRALCKATKQSVVLVSIHANAQALPPGQWGSAHGTTAFVWRPFTGKPSADSMRLASLMLEGVSGNTDLDPGRGIKSARFTVLNVPCPAVLVECGFMTNLLDATQLASTETVQGIARGIVDAVKRFAE